MGELLLGERRLHFLFEGGGAELPVLLLSNSLGTDLTMWDDCMPGLLKRFRVLRYDTRGHGASDAVAGEYTLEMLGRDVLAVMDWLEIGRTLFCGISLGGMTGQWLAIHAPERLLGVVLANTASAIGTHEGWNARIEAVREEGMAALAEGLMARWFTPEFIGHQPEKLGRIVAGFAKTSVEGYCGCCAALRDADLTEALARIHVPALVFAGMEDAVTNPDQGAALAKGIAGASYRQLRGRHLAPLENIEEFNEALVAFADAEGL